MATTSKDILTWAVAEVIDPASLEKKLSGSKKLIVKLGVDPTSADLHLGHAVVLRKLRQFQDLGHLAVLVIGDFTAGIGDPSGRNQSRPVASPAEIRTNMATYVKQASLILDTKKAKVVYNSSWLGKLNLADFLSYAKLLSVNNLLEREDFKARLSQDLSLGLHEVLYPVAQSIDSVELRADVELGGADQRLNLLLARELQKKVHQPSQDLVIMKVLVGLDGVKKMSKSLKNYIGLTDSSDGMFGKVMSIPDALIVEYSQLAALMGSEAEVKTKLKNLHPRDQKALVAKTIVSLYHGPTAGALALERFNETFRDKKVSDHLATPLSINENSMNLIELVSIAMTRGRTYSARLIDGGAVMIDGKKIKDPNFEVVIKDNMIMRVGKHNFFRIQRHR